MGIDKAIRLARSRVALGPGHPPWVLFGPCTSVDSPERFLMLEFDRKDDARRARAEWIAEFALLLLGHPRPIDAIDHAATIAGRFATADELVQLALSVDDR